METVASRSPLDTKRVFVVHSENTLPILKTWLSDRKYNAVYPWLTDKAGNRMIGLNWDNGSTPDKRGLVIVTNPELIEQATKACEEGATS